MENPAVDPITTLLNPALWSQFGPMGLIAVALFAVLWKMLDRHQAERAEMRQEARERAEQLMTLQRETNLAIQGLTMTLERSNDRHRRGEVPL